MADEKSLKSSYELAMERLRKSDEDAGITHRPLTDADKAAIAEIRSYYTAKLAEQELLHQSRMRKSIDPAERATMEDDYRRERERLTSAQNAKIEKIRLGDA